MALPLFAVVYATVAWLWGPAWWMAAAYAVLGLVTFVVYASDKAAARRGAWRVKERNLHLLALLGGWPGALVAQLLLRHKTAKRDFRAMFWLTVLLNVAGFVWLSSPAGRPWWAGE